MVRLMVGLGLDVNPEKTEGPTQDIQFLGVGMSTAVEGGGRCVAYIPDVKLERAYRESLALEHQAGEVKVKDLNALLGRLSWMASVLYGTRTLLASGYALMGAAKARGATEVLLNSQVRMDLAAWRRTVQNASPRVDILRRVHTTAMVAWDASFWGMGGHVGSEFFSVSWKSLLAGDYGAIPSFFPFQREGTDHINALELFAGFWLLSLYGERFRGTTLVVQTDNKAARSMVEKFRGTPTHMPLIREVLALCLRLDVRLSAHWIGTKENLLADVLSRGPDGPALFRRHWAEAVANTASRVERATQWRLDPAVFAELSRAYGPFMLDAASDTFKADSQCYRAWSIAEDCLEMDWAGLCVWCFAPDWMMERVLRRFLECKLRQPAGTGALFLVTVDTRRQFYRTLQSSVAFSCVRRWETGEGLFLEPVSPYRGGGYRPARGATRPVEAWLATPGVPAGW